MKTKQNKIHLRLEMFRYMPVFVFVIMLIHVAMLLLGIDLPVAEMLVIVILFVALNLLSKMLDFCLVHRMCINYALTIFVCMWLRRYAEGEYGLFGEYISVARLTLLVIGLVLVILLIRKKECS